MAEKQPTISTPEEWRPVPGFEGAYEVSDRGRVRSLDRIVTDKSGIKQRRQGRILALTADRGGYLSVRLGRAKTVKVHRLVLGAFVGPAPEGQECCHNDGNPANNHLGNLRWGSRSENALDRVRHGTHHQAAKTHCPRGHELVAPNLVLYEVKRGYRTCLACSRAHAYIQYHPGMKRDFQQVSDSYYEKIMAQQAADDYLVAIGEQYALFAA